jgi:hypothetical protein
MLARSLEMLQRGLATMRLDVLKNGEEKRLPAALLIEKRW